MLGGVRQDALLEGHLGRRIFWKSQRKLLLQAPDRFDRRVDGLPLPGGFLLFRRFPLLPGLPFLGLACRFRLGWRRLLSLRPELLSQVGKFFKTHCSFQHL
ncbi:hypothetical protein D9M69_651340 [compost metagenome]